MPATAYNSKSLSAATFAPITTLPPFSEFLPGTTSPEMVVLEGEEGSRGMVAAMKFESGGFRYTRLPLPESAFLIEGTVHVAGPEGGFEVGAGEGFYLPAGWTGTVEATTPVTKVFHVL